MAKPEITINDPRDWPHCKHERPANRCSICFKITFEYDVWATNMKYFKSIMNFMGSLMIGEVKSVLDSRLVDFGSPNTMQVKEWENLK